MFGSGFGVREHLACEYAGRVDRAGAGWFVEQLTDVIVQIDPLCVVVVRLDSHDCFAHRFLIDDYIDF